VVFSILVSIMVVLLVIRSPALVTITRGPGNPFTVLEGGMVANPIKFKIQDRSEHGGEYSIALEGVEGGRIDGLTSVRVEAGETFAEPLTLVVPPEAFATGRLPVTIRVRGEGFEKSTEYMMRGPVHRAGGN
jgi:hypothetical protein